MLIVKKIKPMFTALITTMDKYEIDNLTKSGSGTGTLDGSMTVDNNVTLSGGTINITNTTSKTLTVNGNLNPYAFLITTLHEFAHHITFEEYSNKVSPHGVEWKHAFKLLLQPVIYHPEFPVNIRIALEKSLHNLKASSCSDIHLSRELAKFDSDIETLILLETLPHGAHFLLQNKIFYKGELRRKRFLCTEIRTNKNYLVSGIAKVKIA